MIIPKKLRYTLMFRWSIATAAPVALFWAVWYLVNGSVPISSIASFYGIPIPFTISRWWDVLTGPIVSILVVLLSRPIFEAEGEEVVASGLIFSLGWGFIAGVGKGIVVGIVVGIIVGIATGVVIALFSILYVTLSVCFRVLKRWLFPMDLMDVLGAEPSSGADKHEEKL